MANSEEPVELVDEQAYGDADLDSVTKLETITDVVDLDDLAGRLPGGWSVSPDMVQFEDGDLEETLLVRRGADDPQLVLKPTEMTDPTGEIEFYERRHVTAARTRRLIAESLDEALMAAVNWVHQRSR